MATSTDTTHRLTVSDSREQRLNGGPSLTAEYDFASLDDAQLLGQLLLGQEISAPGHWRHSIAGGVREVTIVEIPDNQP